VPSVLLIDDDLELLRQLATQFAAAGYHVAVATDGEIGLAKMQLAPFDLVITDIIMPVREGVETIIAVRKTAPKVKVIAISGGYRVGPGDFLTLAEHLGAHGTLAKPFRPSALVALADRVLSDRDLADGESADRGASAVKTPVQVA
jgi:DNA-binding response OmpR family regulator